MLVKRVPKHIIPDIKDILKPSEMYQDAKRPYGRDEDEKNIEVILNIDIIEPWNIV